MRSLPVPTVTTTHRIRVRRERQLAIAAAAERAGAGDAEALCDYVTERVAALLPSRSARVVRDSGHSGEGPDDLLVPLTWGSTAVGVLHVEGAGRRDSDADAFVGTVAGILAQALALENALEALHYGELHDPLTRVANQDLLRDRIGKTLDRCVRRNASAAVMLVDLDRFGRVNEECGYQAGDALLTQAARRVLDVLRAEDTLGRLAGDEFVVLCEDSGEETATSIAGRIVAALHRPFQLDARRITVGASVGVVLASAETDTERLLRDAGAAVAAAKAAGGGRYRVFSDAGRSQPQRAERIHRDLEAATERDELVLVYQPLVALGREPTVPASGDVIVGAEALLRWRNPLEGWLAPGDFIPIAEATGQVVAMGSWTLHEACRQVARWRPRVGSDGSFTVFVNLSQRHLAEPSLISSLVHSLDETGADPSGLGIEITERVMDADDEVVATLEMLIAVGVKVAIDDFGTLHTPLERFRRFPVDVIKIDARYIAGLERQLANRAMISAVSAMARELGIAVCAKGVETAAQLEVVRDLGCHMAQGFYLGRPCPPAGIDQLLGANRQDLPHTGA